MGKTADGQPNIGGPVGNDFDADLGLGAKD